MVAAAAVPLALAGLALLDGALAGFRAATGRNGMIDKRAYYTIAARRGLLTSVTSLGLLAGVLLTGLAVAADPAGRYATFIRAGTGLLAVIGPFATVVIASLIGYAVLPRRPATFLILLGLGPLTLVRPFLIISAGAVGVWWADDATATIGVALAVVGVLAVEPYVHHRWYADVTPVWSTRKLLA